MDAKSVSWISGMGDYANYLPFYHLLWLGLLNDSANQNLFGTCWDYHQNLAVYQATVYVGLEFKS